MSGFLYERNLVVKDPTDGHLIRFIVLNDPEEDIFELGEDTIVVERGLVQIFTTGDPDDNEPLPAFSPKELLEYSNKETKLKDIWDDDDFWFDRLKNDFPELSLGSFYFYNQEVYWELVHLGEYYESDIQLFERLTRKNYIQALRILINKPEAINIKEAISCCADEMIRALSKEPGTRNFRLV